MKKDNTGDGKSKHNIVIGLNVDDYILQAYSQLIELEGVSSVPAHSRFVRLLYKKLLGFSRRLYDVFRIGSDPLSSLIAYRELAKLNLNQGDTYNFILIESPQAICPGYVSSLKRRYPESTCTLILVNTLNEYKEMKKWVVNVEKTYDLVISCNKADSQKYRWEYFPDSYTPEPSIVPSDTPRYDVIFLAADKGRAQLAHSIYIELIEKGIKCLFMILGSRNPEFEDSGFIYLSKAMKYKEYLALVANTRCILEITAAGENYSTLRTMEAVSYGRKLITTNQWLRTEPFFDSRQMMILEPGKSISIDFIRQTHESYNVDSSFFLPEHLLNFVNLKLKMKGNHGNTV